VLTVPRPLRSSCQLPLVGQGPVAGTAGSVVRELRTAPGPGGSPRGSSNHNVGHSPGSSGVVRHLSRRPSLGRSHEELPCAKGTTRTQELLVITAGRPKDRSQASWTSSS